VLYHRLPEFLAGFSRFDQHTGAQMKTKTRNEASRPFRSSSDASTRSVGYGRAHGSYCAPADGKHDVWTYLGV